MAADGSLRACAAHRRPAGAEHGSNPQAQQTEQCCFVGLRGARGAATGGAASARDRGGSPGPENVGKKGAHLGGHRDRRRPADRGGHEGGGGGGEGEEAEHGCCGLTTGEGDDFTSTAQARRGAPRGGLRGESRLPGSTEPPPAPPARGHAANDPSFRSP